MKTNEYVTHLHFGEGKIISETKDKIEIYFPGYGTKVFSKEALEELGILER